MINSIGLIESRGLVALIEAADVILKNSPVKILGINKLNNGLVTLSVYGESDYVKAAIDAGVESGKKVGEIYAYSVIDDPSDELFDLYGELFNNTTKKNVDVDKDFVINKSIKNEQIIQPDKNLSEVKLTDAKDSNFEKKYPVKASKKNGLRNKRATQINKPDLEEKEIIAEKESSNEKPISTIDRLREEAFGKKIKKDKIKKSATVDENFSADIKTKETVVNTVVDYELVNTLNVHKLRHYARTFPEFPIKGRMISRANREELVELFKTLSAN